MKELDIVEREQLVTVSGGSLPWLPAMKINPDKPQSKAEWLAGVPSRIADGWKWGGVAADWQRSINGNDVGAMKELGMRVSSAADSALHPWGLPRTDNTRY